MAICNIEEALAEIKNGGMIILMDDETRENEGDLVMAAEKVTPEAINFMAIHGRGLICLPMAPELIDKLNLPVMAQKNESSLGTNFTVSIEARTGVTTGISAFDRATTILTAIQDDAKPYDLVSPGHVFPLRSDPGGVLVRAGQTEGSVDLAKLAGLKPAAVICEVMKEDGYMARLPDLEKFAKKHNVKITTNKELIHYRLRHDKTVLRRISEANLPTAIAGKFKIFAYQNWDKATTHLALVKGEIKDNEPTLVRVHSECLTGDVFGSKRCDCGQQLTTAMQMIDEKGTGVILYMRQEGRGIGLANKICAYNLQDHGLDTVEANEKLGFQADLRDYGIGAQILLDLGVRQIRLLTNNPKKLTALDGYGLKIVEHIPLQAETCPDNILYLKTKKDRMGHFLNLEEKIL
jgi:3,4-dihydroxy 2-butanone 4-phosphate synthase/GTP cyclohydrolase II